MVVPGRCRDTAAFTARSRPSLSSVASSRAMASRYRRVRVATTARMGPTITTPSCWNGHSSGYRKSGRPLIASKTLRSQSGTLPLRTTPIPASRMARPTAAASASPGRRS
jgi:hypothetical protein